MKHVSARRVLAGLFSVLPLATFAASTHRVTPPPPDSPLALLPVDPRVKSRSPDHERNGDTHRDRGYPTVWIRQHGTPVYDQATAITASHDYVFTVGSAGQGIDGNASAGGQDAFLMKHSLGGTHQWTRQIGSAANDYATGVAISQPAHPVIYVTGYTSGIMPGVSGLNAGGTDLFLTKYDEGGNSVWTRQIGTSGNDYAQAVATDAAGNVYVVGSTTGNLDANNNAGLKDAFLVKYNASGDKQWTRLLGSIKNDEARAVAVGTDGAIYVAGLTYGSLPDNTSAGDVDMFLARYDDAGTRWWVKQFGTSDVDVAQGVTTTSSATGVVDVYVSGYTLGAFGGPRQGGYDAVVAKYSGLQGVAGWKVQRGSPGNDLAYGITSDGASNLFFTGTTHYDLGTNLSAGSNDVFLTELRASDGVHRLSRQLGSTHADGSLDEGDIAFGVTLDRGGGIYVAGYTEGEFDDTLLAGDKDVLIAKYGGGCDALAQGTCVGAHGWGDPHNVTFDLTAYNFQAVGEFILAESTTSSFTVQVRQANWGGGAAVFSAVAARVGADRIGIYRGNPANVFINGTPTAITGFTPLPDGGSISRQSDGAFLVAWPGSERMKVYDRGNYLDVYVFVPSYQRGHLRGLMGNANGNPSDDFALRDGTPLTAPLTFEQMYRDANCFAHSWRITQAESLFDYANGQNTATFTDLNAPYTWPSSQDFTPQQRLDAETVCLNAGVTQPFALEACILDVGLTGDPGFATSAAGVEASVLAQSPGVPAPAPQPLYTQDFEGLVGPEWSHTQTSLSPVGGRRFLGAFDDQVVTLEVPHLPDHSKVTISFDLFVIGAWAGNTWAVNIDGVGTQSTSFSNSTSPQTFPEWNTSATNPAYSGAAEVGSLGYATGDAVYKVKLTVDHFDPALRLDFFGQGLGSGVQSWGVDNVQVQLQ